MEHDFDMRILMSVHFVDNQTGWIVGQGGKVLKTADGGLTWTAQNGGSSQLTDVYFIDSLHGWICGDEGTVLVTRNGGDIWTEQTTSTTISFNSLLFVSKMEGWVVGANGTILYTKDGGVTWQPQQSSTENGLFHIDQSPDGTIWTVGESSAILKY